MERDFFHTLMFLTFVDHWVTEFEDQGDKCGKKMIVVMSRGLTGGGKKGVEETAFYHHPLLIS